MTTVKEGETKAKNMFFLMSARRKPSTFIMVLLTFE